MSGESGKKKEGVVYITLDSYLSIMSEIGPLDQRKKVPTIRELARAIGIHEVTLHNIAKGRIKHLNLDTARAILDEMNRRGFPMDLADLIKYIPPSPPHPQS